MTCRQSVTWALPSLSRMLRHAGTVILPAYSSQWTVKINNAFLAIYDRLKSLVQVPKRNTYQPVSTSQHGLTSIAIMNRQDVWKEEEAEYAMCPFLIPLGIRTGKICGYCVVHDFIQPIIPGGIKVFVQSMTSPQREGKGSRGTEQLVMLFCAFVKRN